MNTSPYRQWQCAQCGDIYDEALGQPESGIPAGTRFEDLPKHWVCANCGADASNYVPL